MPIPKLPSYQDPMERFYTHKLLESPNALLRIGLVSDPRLKRNMALYQNRYRDATWWRGSEAQGQVALFWLNMALSERSPRQEWEPDNRKVLAWQHLICYCEDVAYWAATKAWNQRPIKTWPEYFDAASGLIYREPKLLKLLQSYDRNQSSLDTFLQKSLLNDIATRVSKWRLLGRKKSSDSHLTEALQEVGYKEADISRFIFGRRCFYDVYQRDKLTELKASRQKWPDPDEADFREAAELYNIRKSQRSAPHEVFVNADITGRELQEWMEFCIEAIRNYPQSFQTNYLDQSAAEAIAAPEPELVEEDIFSRDLAEKAEPILQEKFLAFNANQQRSLLLIYGFGLTQQRVAEIDGVIQSAIAQRLRTPRKNLAKALDRVSLGSERVPQEVAEWLRCYYRAPIYSEPIQAALVKEHQELKPEEREALRRRYGAESDNYSPGKSIAGNSPDPPLCQQAESKLEKSLRRTFEKWLKKYIDDWLAKFSGSIVQFGCDRLNIPWESRAEIVIIDDLLTECLTILTERKGGQAND